MTECRIEHLYDLRHTMAAEFLRAFCYPWEALAALSEFLICTCAHLPKEYREAGEGVWIHESASVSARATLCAPCIVGAYTEIRCGAYVRGNALIGRACVVGNSTEIKNAVLFDGVQVPHYNYVGDSILGYRAHLGAGAVLSNVKGDASEVVVEAGEERIATGRKKCGAFLGDGAEIGCNSVLCPGTVVGRGTRVYPLVLARGVYPPAHIVKPCAVVPIDAPDPS